MDSGDDDGDVDGDDDGDDDGDVDGDDDGDVDDDDDGDVDGDDEWRCWRSYWWLMLLNAVIMMMTNRVSHITPFFELSDTLLTTHAIGLYEVTKKFSAL